MRASDLRLDELLDLPREGGVLRFAGQRVMLVDTLALGFLRKELVAAFGLDTARQLMTRVGYQHGWHTAETLERELPWASADEWRRAARRLPRLRGMATLEPVAEPDRLEPPAFVEAIWRDSYEVEQHLLHFGEAEDPVCWSISGFTSGYLSRAYGRAVACEEILCRGRGDSLCRMRGDQRTPLRFEPRSRGANLQVGSRNLDMSLAAVEREHILAVLDDSNGNKAEAARRLGIGTATLFRKLKRYRE